VAIVVVAALGSAYFFLRHRSWGKAGEQAPHKTTLVVVPFRAASGSESLAWVGEAVPIFESLALEESLDWKVLTPERVYDLSKPAGLGSSQAELDMARKGGADFLLRGEVSGAPGAARLKASWVQVASGKELASWTVEGIAEDSLGNKLDEIAAQVSKALGPSATPTEHPRLASLVPIKEEPTRSYLSGAEQLAKGEPGPALEALAGALKLDDFPLARFTEAMAAAQRGEPARTVKAASSLEKLTRPMPARVRLLTPVFLALYNSGNPRSAVAPLESFLARFPDEKAPLSRLGAIEHLLLKEPDRAREALQHAFDLDPTVTDTHRLLGQATLESGHPAEAIPILQSYLEKVPDDESARLVLARAQRDAGKTQDSLGSIDKVLSRLPENPTAMSLKGGILLDQGKPQEAAALYKTLTASTQPRARAQGLFLQGKLDLLTGRFNDGFKTFRDAVEQARLSGNPTMQGQYLMSLAQAFTSLGRHQEALTTYSEVRSLDADFDPELPIISVLVAQKQYDNARHLMDTQVAMWHDKLSQETLDRLQSSLEGNIALDQGKYADAVAKIRAALPPKMEGDPTSEQLARAYLGAGSADKAAAIFKKIVDDPDRYADPVGYVQCQAKLGEASEKIGKKEDAVKAYQEVLRWWGTTDFPQPETSQARDGLKRLGG
jgi:tetratricopeptide (TPR) repeat protein